MGLVSDTERQEFETLCNQYAEIAAARDSFEKEMEKKLLSDAKEPPQHLKQLIEAKVMGITPASIHSIADRSRVVSIGVWKWIAAASIILLVAAGYWGWDNDHKNKELIANNEILQNQLQQSNATLSQLKDQADMLQKPGLKMAALKGTPLHPQALASIYWDSAGANKDVYLMINNMPQPPSGKQYQLWALFNGKPIDLGVFDMQVKQNRLLVRMKNVQNAQAFAITLEPNGGSVNPTMKAMYVMGTL